MAPRLSLLEGQPVEPFDCISPTLFCGDYGAPQFSLNLAGTSALTLHDVYTDHSQMVRAPMPSMEVQVSGRPIGGMTGNGGLASIFDGNTTKGYATSGKSPGATSGYVNDGSAGLALTPPLAITRIKAFSPNNGGFIGNNQRTEWELLYSDTENFATAIVIKNGITPPNLAAISTAVFESLFSNGTPRGFWWLALYGNGVNAIYLTQLQMFATLPFAARGLTTVGGVQVNSNAVSAIGNSGPVSVPAQAMEWLGTILISETAGVMRFTESYGLDRMVPIWNAKNREPVEVVAGDNGPTVGGHFTYTPAAQDDYGFVQAMNKPSFRLTVVNGLAEGSMDVEYSQAVFMNAASAPAAYWNSFGLKLNDFSGPSTSPASEWGEKNFDNLGDQEGDERVASGKVHPWYGAMRVNAIEGARGNVSCFYGEPNQRLSARLEY